MAIDEIPYEISNDVRNLMNGLVALGNILENDLKGHEQFHTVEQLQRTTFRLKAILDPLLGNENANRESIIFTPKESVEKKKKKLANKGEFKKFNAHILVVEDHKYHQIVAKEVLAFFGCTVDITDNGFTAVEKLEANKYDAVFLDIDIYGINGIEVAKRFRKSEKQAGKHLPIVAMTSYTSQTSRNECERVGMDAIIDKPYELTKVAEVLESFLKPVKEKAVTPPKAEEPQKMDLDLSLLKFLADYDPIKLADEVKKVVEYLDVNMQKLKKAIDANEMKNLHELANRTASTAQVCGSNDLRDLFFALCNAARLGQQKKCAELFNQIEEKIKVTSKALIESTKIP